MRKAVAIMLLVFVMAFLAGASIPSTADAGPCYYKCICSVPHKCCINAYGVEVCKPVPNGPIQCPQVFPC